VAAFDSQGLVAAAKKRYGEAFLREMIRGSRFAADDDAADDAADAELLEIARSVLDRAQTALQTEQGWPLPGKWPAGAKDAAGGDITGQPYADRWPFELFQKSLELFYYRVLAPGETISSNERDLGKAAEKYFDRLEEGAPLGIGGATDVSAPLVRTVRDRSGRSNVPGIEDRTALVDDMAGLGWDRHG
jgi:hypothetical protein